jgi:hypothetical protein
MTSSAITKRIMSGVYDAVERAAHQRFECRFLADVRSHDYLRDEGIRPAATRSTRGYPSVSVQGVVAGVGQDSLIVQGILRSCGAMSC